MSGKGLKQETSRWREVDLGGLVTNFDARRVPLSSRVRSERRGPYPYYGAAGVVDYIDDYLFEGLHLLVAEDGSVETPNGTPFVQLVDGKFWVNNHAHVLQASSENETRYLYYALSTVPIRPFMSGSVQAKLSQTNLNRIPVPYPVDPSRRHTIAHVLGTLDDKIELNRLMNETLEGMARALFKSWFVDFEPVRAKMEGRWRRGETLPGLPAGHYDLFPNRLVPSELGEIPEGWEAGSFANIVRRRNDRVREQEAVVLSAIASGELVRSDDQFKKRVYSRSISKYIVVRQWDVAYNPSRINIGSVGLHKDPWLGAVSPVYVVVEPKAGFHWYLDFTLELSQCKSWIETLASGSVRQSLSYQDFSSIPWAIPDPSVVEHFNRHWEEIRRAILAHESESHSLTNQREALLPMLLLGTLTVDDIDSSLLDRTEQ